MMLTLNEIQHLNNLHVKKLTNPVSLHGQMMIDIQKMRMDPTLKAVPISQGANYVPSKEEIRLLHLKSLSNNESKNSFSGDWVDLEKNNYFSSTPVLRPQISGLECTDPHCTCNKGVSGVGCGCNKASGLSGLDGLSIDTTGLVTGAVIGAVVGHFAGWGWQVSAGIGALVNGFVIPSMTS